MAGAFAKRINARKLILTHFSIRSDVLGEVRANRSSFHPSFKRVLY